jgi:hypothetical protein
MANVDTTHHTAAETARQEIAAQAPPSVDACVREAIASLTGPRFNAGVTFEQSEAFWEAVAPAKREIVARVRSDAGADDDAAQTRLGLEEAYAEVHLFRRSMFIRLLEGAHPGPITGKGRTKALYTAYLSALDRETKLAQLLGLERRARSVGDESIEAYVARATANPQREED